MQHAITYPDHREAFRNWKNIMAEETMVVELDSACMKLLLPPMVGNHPAAASFFVVLFNQN